MSDSELNDPNLTQQSNSSVNETIQRLRKRIKENDKQLEEKDKRIKKEDKQLVKQLEEKDKQIEENEKRIKKEDKQLVKQLEELDKQLEEKDKQLEEKDKRIEENKKQIENFFKIRSNYTTNDDTNKFKFPPLHYNQGVERTDGQIQCAEINEVKTDPIVDGVVFDVSNFPFFEKDEEGDLYDIPSANFSHNKGGLTYENEAGVQHHTLQMVKDAIMCAGLGQLYEPHLEFSMFSVRPDIVVVQTKETPRSVLMCIEVKSPGKREEEDATKKDEVVFDKDVFRSKKVAFQMFNYLMAMKQLGSVHPIACLSTYDQMCMTFLEDPNEFTDIDNHIQAVQKHVTNNFIVEKVPITIATNSKEEGPSPGKHRRNSDASWHTNTTDTSWHTNTTDASWHTNTTADLVSVNQESEEEIHTNIDAGVHYTAVKTCDIFPYLVSTMLLAYELYMNTEHVECLELSSKPSLNDKYIGNRHFPLVTANKISWVTMKSKEEVKLVECNDKIISGNQKNFFLLETLGQGNTGKVFLACSALPSLIVCAIKVYIPPTAKAESNCDDSDGQPDCIENPEEDAKSTRDREFLLWKELYEKSSLFQNFCRKVDINNYPALVMPYGRQICVDDRAGKEEDLKKKLQDFAKKGYVYNGRDLRWRHVLEDVNQKLFLVDLESLEKHGLKDKEQIERVVEEQLKGLMDRK